MIQKNQRLLNKLNGLSDGVIILLSYLFSTWFWLDVVNNTTNMAAVTSVRSTTFLVALLYTIWVLILLTGFRVYRRTRTHKRAAEMRGILLGNALALVTGAAFLYLFRLEDFSRGVVAVFYLSSTFCLILKRVVLYETLKFIRKKGFNLKHILVVGDGALSRRYVDTVLQKPGLGIDVCCILPPKGNYESVLEKRLYGVGIDEVVLALEPSDIGATETVIHICEKCGTKISVIPFYNDIIPTRPNIDMVGKMKLIQLRTTPLDELLNAGLKRTFDIVSSTLLLLLLSPLLLFVALAVKLSSPGPVFFRQTRVGLNKKEFLMFKFRSMKVNVEQDTAWSTKQDDRRTWIGSLLRKTSLDELPQLWNVLKGDMSLVGPRPELPFFVEQFRETVPLYMVKYQVRPGITGWAQVNGLRGDTSIPARVEHDLWYIENWSLGLDVKIIFKTVFGGMLNSEKMGGGGTKAEQKDQASA